MSYWLSNLEFFKKNAAAIHKRMTADDNDEDITCTWHEDKQQLSARKDNKDIWLGSIFDSKREAEKVFEGVDENSALVVLLGIGNLALISEIKKKFKHIKRLLIVEPSVTIFNEVMKRIPVREVFAAFPKTDISILLKEDMNSIHLNFRVFSGQYSMEESAVIASVAYAELFPFYRTKLAEFLFTASFQKDSTVNTHAFFRYIWPVNEWKNFKINAPSTAGLLPLFREMPVIVVSAGPSLNKNMHLLKLVKNKAIIIAVGSAVRILHKNGIVPHFRMAIEGSSLCERIFEDIDPNECPLIYTEPTYYETVKTYEHNSFALFLIGHGYLKRYLYSKLSLPFNDCTTGPSVANVALIMSIYLRSRKVILMGQDLCFTNNTNYADGAWTAKEEDEAFVEGRNNIKMKDIFGNEVYTMGPYYNVKRMFELIAEWNPKVEYINATEGGLNIVGFKNKTFASVLQEELTDSLEIPDIAKYISDYLEDYRNNNVFTEQLRKDAIDMLKKDIKDLIKQNVILKKTSTKVATAKQMDRVNKQLDKMRKTFVYSELCGKGFDKVEAELLEAIKSENFYAQERAAKRLAAFVDEYAGFMAMLADDFLSDENLKLVFNV